MRSLTTLLLLAILAAPGAHAAGRIVAYCDTGGSSPTCGVGVGDRDDNCGTGTVSPCSYTQGGVGAGVRLGDGLLCEQITYCFDVHAGPAADCVGEHGVYAAGHNDVYEGGATYCAEKDNGACDSFRDIILRVLSQEYVVSVSSMCRTILGHP
jgi:hypothetical protein